MHEARHVRCDRSPTAAVMAGLAAQLGPAARLTVRAGDQRAEVTGPVPETARNRALTAEELQARLKKTGGTAFRCREVRGGTLRRAFDASGGHRPVAEWTDGAEDTSQCRAER